MKRQPTRFRRRSPGEEAAKLQKANENNPGCVQSCEDFSRPAEDNRNNAGQTRRFGVEISAVERARERGVMGEAARDDEQNPDNRCIYAIYQVAPSTTANSCNTELWVWFE